MKTVKETEATGTDVTLVERLVRTLEDEIVSGRQTSGVRMDEQRLADWFGVSRTPVREALRELVATGLVEKRPHRSFTVKQLTQQELSDLFETMAVLEATCGRLAAERMTAEELKRLRVLSKEMNSAAKEKNPDHYDALNREFHGLIYEGAHNDVLVDVARSTRRRTTPFRRAQFLLEDRITTSHAEHKRIVAAIVARDANEAYDSLYDHIISARDSACDYLANLNKQLILGSITY